MTPRWAASASMTRSIRGPSTDPGATAFARIKSIIVTGMKNGVRFAQYGIEVVRAKLQGQPLPLPLADNS